MLGGMPDVIRELPRVKPGRSLKYPWPQWADGQARRFERHADFDITAKGFAIVARSWARTHGYELTSRVDGDDVYLQFRKSDATDEA